MSKREYQGREVAVKKLRIYDTSDLQNVIRVRCQWYNQFLTVLTITRTGVLQGVCVVEGPSTSKRVAAPRSDNDRDRVLDGVGLDAEREHKPVRGCTSGCESL